MPKPHIIVKKTSTTKATGIAKVDGATLRRYISEYMDETQKRPVMPGLKYTMEEAKIKHGVKQREAEHPGLRQGVDYLSKEPQGQVGVHGFLKRLVEAKTGRKLSALSNREKADATEEIWRAKLAEKGLKKIAHKFVFSLDPDLTDQMKKKGIPVDENLTSIVHESWRRFQQKFYPGQELGYLLGIHHDRRHIHAHVLLYPQTSEGRALNVSRASELPNLAIANRPRRVDYQEFITMTAFELAEELAIRVKSRPGMTRLPVEYVAQERLLSQAAQDDVSAQGASAPQSPDQPVKSVAIRRELELLGEDDLRKVLLDQYTKRSISWASMTPEAARTAERDAKEKQIVWRDYLRDLAKVRHQKSAPPLGDIMRARGMIMGWQWIGWGSMDGYWWSKREKDQNDLGHWMRKTRSELTAEFAQSERQIPLTGRALHYRRKRLFVDRHLIELDRLKMHLEAQAELELKAARKTKQHKLEMVTLSRHVGHRLSHQKADARGKRVGERPLYLRQFDHWKSREGKLPVFLVSRVPTQLTDPAKIEHRRQVAAQSRIATEEDIVEANPRVVQDDPEEIDSPMVFIPDEQATGPASLQPIVGVESPKAILAKIDTPEPDQAALDELGIDLR